MDKFKGLKALRKTIELVLQKLNMYQDKMNEISREELLEIMGNNDLDLSWIASQESVDALSIKIDNIQQDIADTNVTIGDLKILLNKALDMIEMVGSKDDPTFGGYEVAPENEIDNWNYTVDGNNVTLTGYKGSSTSVVIYDKYKVSEVYRKTRITNIPINSSVTTLRICDKVINDIQTADDLLCYKSALTSIDFGKSFSDKHFKSLNSTFRGCKPMTIKNMFNTSEVTSMKYTFAEGTAGTSMIKSYIDVTNVTTMEGIFSNWKGSYSNINWSGINLENLESLRSAFTGCTIGGYGDSLLPYPASATNVKDVSGMYSSTKINISSSGDRSESVPFANINVNMTCKPTNMSYLFAGWTGPGNVNKVTNTGTVTPQPGDNYVGLIKLQLTGVDFSCAENVSRMFNNVSNFLSNSAVRIKNGNINIPATTDQSNMFAGSSFNGLVAV